MTSFDQLPTAVAMASGLTQEDSKTILQLIKVWQDKLPRNELRHRYYTMHQKAESLGIAIPPKLEKLEQVCGWPAKTVDILANRSQFDGFVSEDDEISSALSTIVSLNKLKRGYRKACKNQLELCCAFITCTDGGGNKPIIRTYPAMAASAIWNQATNAIKAGLVIVDHTEINGQSHPSWIDVFTEDSVITCKLQGNRWIADYHPHSMGRCLMEAMPYEADDGRPFGKSRINRAVMNITDNAMRSSLRAELSGEFFTSPQKYLLGTKSDAFEGEDAPTMWEAYIGNIFTISKDSDGDTPQFGQLPQGSMQPHQDYMRGLAARFSGETNVPLHTLGVISDNPSSAEAIYAAKEELIIDAQNLNADNGEALRDIAYMALAIKRGTDYETECTNGYGVQARFRNPAMPSLVSRADSAVKIASAAPWFAESNVFLEELGFTDDVIQRLEKERRQYQADRLLEGIGQELNNEQSNGIAV